MTQIGDGKHQLRAPQDLPDGPYQRAAPNTITVGAIVLKHGARTLGV